MKNHTHLAALLLISACSISSVCASVPVQTRAATFTDVPAEHWAASYIEDIAARGVVNGVGDGSFNPDGEVSGAEFAVMLARAFWSNNLTWYGTEADAAWWEAPVAAVHAQSGFSWTNIRAEYINNQYQWTDALTLPMTRYDMASMVYNLLAAKQAAMPDEEAISAATSSLLDWSEVPYRYQGTVPGAIAAGILTGKEGGTFSGNDTLTRAEAAAVIYRLFAAGIS